MIASIPLIKLIEAMNEQPIAFNKHYVFLGCGINGALMLSQLVYWTSRTKDPEGWIFKTQHEWTMETGMTRKEQETARKTLRNLGFLSEKKSGVPCRVYFRVERENLYQALVEYAQTIDISSMHKSDILNAQNVHTECADGADCTLKSDILCAQIGQSNTENTTENTTESNLGADAPAKAQKFSAKKFLIENGVSDQTASEYIELRNKKKKPITEKVIQLVLNQADQACISNERAFQIIVVRGWESFKASWNWSETNAELDQLENPKSSQTQPEKQDSQPQQYRGVTKKFKGM